MTEQTIDSLVANEFTVALDDTAVDGVFRVSGLTLFKAAGESTLVVTKIVQRDPQAPFNKWLKDTLSAAGGNAATRKLTVTAVDDGVAVRRWTFSDASVASVTYSDFDSSSAELVEERVVINYGAVAHQWVLE